MRPIALPPSVRLETAVGPILLPRDDGVMRPWIEAHGNWEPGESAALAALVAPGDSVVEIGAHVGYLTLLLARAAGPDGSVLAIEAHPENHALLQENVRTAGLANVRAVHAAAWRSPGEIEVTISPDNTGDHRVYAHDGVAERVSVPAVLVDDLLAGAGVDVVKVDAQGVDHVALEGMQRTIARSKPTILLEFWPHGIEQFGDRPLDVATSYLDMGYDACILEAPILGGRAQPDDIVAVARRAETGFCTLILHGR